MPPRVESRIVVNVNAIVSGLPNVKALGFNIQNIARFAADASSGLGRFDTAMSKSQREASKLSSELRELQRELDALNRKIAREGQFATPSDIGRARTLASQIAERERALSEKNHLAAADQIKKQREAKLQALAAERQATAKAAADDAAATQRTLNDRAKINASLAKQRQDNARETTRIEETEANAFRERIAQRVALRQREQAALVAGQEQARTQLRATVSSIENVSRRISTGILSPLRALGGFIVGIFQQIVRQVQFFIASFAILAASSPAVVFSLLVKEGLHFLSVMEQQKIGLAALIQSTNDLFIKGQPNKPLEGIEAFNAASIVADASTRRLSIKIIPLKATLEDLLPIFNQIVTAGAAAGLTIEQTEDVFTDFAAVAQVINLPLEKLGTGIRLLLNGTARVTTVLATALFGNARAANEWVKEHKRIGDLAEALHKKLEPFRLALINSESSFAVLAENTKDVFQRLAGIATTGLFERVKAALVSILQSFYDLKALEIKPEFEDLFEFINDQLKQIGSFIVDLTARAIEYLKQIAKYVQDNRAYVEQIIQALLVVLQELGLIVVELGYVIADLVLATKGTHSWLEVLRYVAEVIGGIHDGVNVVIGSFQFLGGYIVAGILAPLYVVLDVLGLISQAAQDAANRIDEARKASQNFGDRGGARFLSGINEENRNRVESENQRRDAVDNVTIDAGNSESIPLHDIETRLKNISNAGSGGAGGGRALNRIGELRKQTADLLRALYRTRIDIERAGEDRSFDLARSANAKQLDELDENLKRRLTSTLDYYQKRKALEDGAIERERKHLVDQFKFDEREANVAISAIEAGFEAQQKEPKNKGAAIQVELSKHRQIKIHEELNKLEEKRVKLNTAILLLDERQADATRKNNLGLEDGLETLRKTNESVQQQLLDAQGRTTAAEIRHIAEQYRDELLTVLRNTNPATEALSEVIENIKQLGNVTSVQLISILNQAELKFEDLSEETKALIALIKQLEESAVFTGLQTEAGNLLGNLDLTRVDVQDQINQGILTEVEGRHQIALAEQAVRVEIEKVIALMEKLPGLTDQEKLALASLKQQASQMGREIDTLGQTINDSIKSNITSLADSAITDFKNIGDHAKRFFTSLIADIGRALVEALVLQRLFAALGLNRPGTTGPGSAGGLGGLFSRITGHHDGGLVKGPPGRDNLLRRLENEEWVIPAARVRQYGHGLMNSITTGTFGRTGSSTTPTAALQRTAKQLPPKVVVGFDRETIANEIGSTSAYQKAWLHIWNTHRNALGV
jgi:hypothetical protein